MIRTRHLRLGLTAVIATMALATGCSTQHPTAASGTPAPATLAPSTPGDDAAGNPQGGGQGSHGQSNGGRAVAPSLPADWPSDVPVPPGQLQGSTAGAGRWSALLVVNSSAAVTMTATARVYTDAGFTAVSDSLFRKGRHLITIGAENRDHSATQTNLVVAIRTLP